MQLRVKFESLWNAVNRISAIRASLKVEIKSSWEDPEYERVASELRKGKEVTLDEIGVAGKLLNYQGQHVLLYIADHGSDVEKVIRGEKPGRRFHVADCSTLMDMKRSGRYSRYVATTNISGLFHIVGVAARNRKQAVEGNVRLTVCQNCLKVLNYKNAMNSNTRVLARDFDAKEFFETYSSLFTVTPLSPDAIRDMALYTKDWNEVSRRVREQANWRCESCGVDLSGHRELLHVHHLNGVKNDNRNVNLVPLCIGCHRQEPNHGHLQLSHISMVLLNKLRRDQHILRSSSWEDAIRFADPALVGGLQLCRKARWPVPEIGYVKAGRSFDAAWPTECKAVDLSLKQTEAVAGWTIYSLGDLLDLFHHDIPWTGLDAPPTEGEYTDDLIQSFNSKESKMLDIEILY